MTDRRVVILGAAGRDFHDFNVAYRDDAGATVVAFTATQIPAIGDRRYPATLAGRRVLVIEDGPTLTHGSMPHGAGFVAARAAGAVVVDARSAAVTSIREVFARHPHIGPVLPALGYSADQLEAFRATIDAVHADLVIAATPGDLARLLRVNKPIVRARYEFAETAEPGLGTLVDQWLSVNALNPPGTGPAPNGGRMPASPRTAARKEARDGS
jgi:predicted GTPase